MIINKSNKTDNLSLFCEFCPYNSGAKTKYDDFDAEFDV